MRLLTILTVGCALCGASRIATAHDDPASKTKLVAPKLVEAPTAPYPAAARRARVRGVVLLELDVDSRGRVTNARVIEGLGHGLDEAARQAALSFRFAPARRAGRPIPARVRFSYRFQLGSKRPALKLPSWAPRAAADAGGDRDGHGDGDRRERARGHERHGSDHHHHRVLPHEHPAPEPPRDAARGDNTVAERKYVTVVSGTRPTRSATDFTFRLNPMTRAPKAGSTAAELLRLAPGVYISQHGGEGKAHQIFLRGFDAVHGEDIEIHVQGIPINEPSNIHGQGYADMNFVIAELVREMRVLEGAYDPRQGDFAVAGSISYRLGLARPGVLTRLSAGRFGLLRMMTAWRPYGAHRDTFVGAELARGNGFGPGRAWRRASALGQFAVQLSSSTKLRLFGSSYVGHFDSAGVLRLDDWSARRVGFFDSYDSDQGGSSARHQLQIALSYRKGPHRAELSSYIAYRALRLRQNFTGYLLDDQGDMNEQHNSTLIIGGRARYQRRFRLLGMGQRFELGARWRHDRIEQSQRRLRAVDAVPYKDEIAATLGVTDIGLYGDIHARLHRRVRLRGGVRLEAAAYAIDEPLLNGGAGSRRDAFGFFVGPKVTLEVKAARWLRLFASYGKGFRSPQARSLGDGEQAPLTEVHSSEVGARWSFGPLLRGSVAGFLTYVGTDFVFDHGSGRNILTGEALRSGVAWLVESQPVSFAKLRISGTWARAQRLDGSGTLLPYAPTLVMRGDLDLRQRVCRLFGLPVTLLGGVGATVLGSRPLPFGESGQPLALIELNAGVEVGPITLSFEAYNLADVRWRDGEFVFSSNWKTNQRNTLVPARHFTAGRPLTVQGTLSARF